MTLKFVQSGHHQLSASLDFKKIVWCLILSSMNHSMKGKFISIMFRKQYRFDQNFIEIAV